jgi:hypothetical protein
MKLARRKFLHLAAGAGALPFALHRKPARRPDFLAARPGTHSSAYSPRRLQPPVAWRASDRRQSGTCAWCRVNKSAAGFQVRMVL